MFSPAFILRILSCIYGRGRDVSLSRSYERHRLQLMRKQWHYTIRKQATEVPLVLLSIWKRGLTAPRLEKKMRRPALNRKPIPMYIHWMTLWGRDWDQRYFVIDVRALRRKAGVNAEGNLKVIRLPSNFATLTSSWGTSNPEGFVPKVCNSPLPVDHHNPGSYTRIGCQALSAGLIQPSLPW